MLLLCCCRRSPKGANHLATVPGMPLVECLELRELGTVALALGKLECDLTTAVRVMLADERMMTTRKKVWHHGKRIVQFGESLTRTAKWLDALEMDAYADEPPDPATMAALRRIVKTAYPHLSLRRGNEIVTVLSVAGRRQRVVFVVHHFQVATVSGGGVVVVLPDVVPLVHLAQLHDAHPALESASASDAARVAAALDVDSVGLVLAVVVRLANVRGIAFWDDIEYAALRDDVVDPDVLAFARSFPTTFRRPHPVHSLLARSHVTAASACGYLTYLLPKISSILHTLQEQHNLVHLDEVLTSGIMATEAQHDTAHSLILLR